MNLEELKEQLEQFDGDEELSIEDESGNDYEIRKVFWHQGNAKILIDNEH